MRERSRGPLCAPCGAGSDLQHGEMALPRYKIHLWGLMDGMIPELMERGCDFIHPRRPPAVASPARPLRARLALSPQLQFALSVLSDSEPRTDSSKTAQLHFHPVCPESPGVCLVPPQPGEGGRELTINSKQKHHYPYGTS